MKARSPERTCNALPSGQKKTLPGRVFFKAQIDATTIWAGVHARDGDGLR